MTSILAPLSGAEYRWGRESRNEFGESIAPEQADKKQWDYRVLFRQGKQIKSTKFIAPSWARKFTKEDLPYRLPDMNDPEENFGIWNSAVKVTLFTTQKKLPVMSL